jgi:predicted MFS family arabinose efflux permease
VPTEEIPPPPPYGGRFAALHSRNFAILWVGNLLSNIGSWMQQVAEPWLVLNLSNSPFLVGLDSFAAGAPVWLFILWGGVLADRRNRRAVIGLFQGIQAACPLLLVILIWLGKINVPIIIALSAVVGITDALSMPAIQALVPSTVPDERVSSAVALNSAQFNLSRVLGPLAAGSVMAAFGAIACFGFNFLSYVPFLGAIWLLSIPAAAVIPGSAGAMPGSNAGSMSEAIRRVRSTPALWRALATVALNALFCSAMVTFAPVLVRNTFHRESGSFGGSLSVFGLGGILGAGLVLAALQTRSRQRLSAIAALVAALLTLAVALAPSFGLFVALFFFVGAAMVTTNAASNSVLQSSVHSDFRGRIGSLYSLALRGGTAVGSILTGLLVTHAGIRDSLLVDGALALASQAWLAALLWRDRSAGFAGTEAAT